MSEDEKKSIWLNDWFPVLGLVGFGVAALLLIFIVKVGALLYALVASVEPDAGNAVEAIRGVGWLFGAFVGGVVAIVFGTWRGFIAEKQTKVARDQYERSLDRDYADLFTKAVEQLGTEKLVKRTLLDEDGNPVVKDGRTVVEEVTEPNIEVRLGAIYALERISQDSERDHIAVMETLCAYVRENAPAERCEPLPVTLLSQHKNDPLRETMVWSKAGKWWQRIFGGALRAWIGTLDAPRADVQAVLTVLGRRSKARVRYEIKESPDKSRYVLDLRKANLRKADMRAGDFRNALLSEAHLEGANLFEAHLEGAVLSGAHLEGAYLSGAHLEGAVLSGAHLEGAVLIQAHLEGAYLREAHLEGAVLSGAHLEGAYLREAHLEGADLRGANLEGADLREAHLEGADLYEAQLKSAKLAMVRIDSVIASFADFTAAEDLSQGALETCFGCAGTVLPEGLDRPAHWHPERLESWSEQRNVYKAWKAARAAGEKPPWVDEAAWSGWGGSAAS